MKSKIILALLIAVSICPSNCFASVKHPEFADQFYPAKKDELISMLDGFLDKADLNQVPGEFLVLISPHAGYGYSGPTAAYGYRLIKGRPYKTVVILGTSHHKPFSGAAIYGQGSFETSLGILKIDEEFSKNLTGKDPELFIDESAFSGEHSVEVQLPFLQRVLGDFKIVPIVVGDCSLDTCKRIATVIKATIGARKDVLLVASSDMYHGYSIKQADQVDALTLDLIKKMDYTDLYYSLRDAKRSFVEGLLL